jgi:hypothetical protein
MLHRPPDWPDIDPVIVSLRIKEAISPVISHEIDRADLDGKAARAYLFPDHVRDRDWFS